MKFTIESRLLVTVDGDPQWTAWEGIIYGVPRSRVDQDLSFLRTLNRLNWQGVKARREYRVVPMIRSVSEFEQ